MPIPDFQSIMLPLLQLLSDGNEHANQQTNDALEACFSLSEDEKSRMLPSGKQRVFANRVAWAKTHMKQAGLIESKRRGLYTITQRGLEVLSRRPERLDMRLLMEFPEYQEFRERKRADAPGPANGGDADKQGLDDTRTPEEDIESGFLRINRNLAKELVASIKGCSPRFFERLVIDLLLAMGYGGSRQEAGRLTGRGSDEGIDGVINEDKLGLDVIYVQAKRWDGSVSRPEIQKFAGALQGKRARKGIYLTTSEFTQGALDFVQNIDSKIILIDGRRLAELMIEHNVGMTVVQAYEVKRVDSDYFVEE